MTAIVPTLVDLPGRAGRREGIFDLGPNAVDYALGQPGIRAVSVRLRGGRGDTNTGRISRRHRASGWGHLLELAPSVKPRYADALYHLADCAGIERRGHGWLSASTVRQAIREARAVAKLVKRLELVAWGVNGERDLIGHRGAYRPQWIRVLAAHVRELQRLCPGLRVEWWGFWSARWHHGQHAEEMPAWLKRLFSAVVQMVYQTEARTPRGTGALDMAERGRAAYAEHALAGTWSCLTSVGRWHDVNRNRRIDPGEIVGDPDTLRALVRECRPAEIHPYVGNGAARQLADGHALHPSIAALAPELAALA